MKTGTSKKRTDTRLRKYFCKECKNTLYRRSSGQPLRSYCLTAGKTVTIRTK